ncbi:MAG: alginate export family protein [Deltaproteobacteria bacterium]|nr:alginate export family protein [Deltaproteobacteria bacterium]
MREVLSRHRPGPRLGPALPALLTLLAPLAAASPAAAQIEAPEQGLAVGDWTLRPMLELRLRAEYRHHPVDTGGDELVSAALLEDGPGTSTPARSGRLPAVGDQWLVAERARLGLAAQWRAITAVLVLQDARVLGLMPSAPPEAQPTRLSTLAPIEAYVDTRSSGESVLWSRVGRQRLVWGDGRLIGENEWAPAGGALDAARFGLKRGPVDVELLASLLAPPGSLPPGTTGAAKQEDADATRRPDGTAPAGGPTTGAQLYGLDAVVRFLPLLGAELTALARFARPPLPAELVPSDTYVVDGRIFGDYRGLRYAAEGAYEAGRVAAIGRNRDLSAFALALRAELETALPGHLTFGLFGAYASGDDSRGDATQILTRFDPILPEAHERSGMMGLYCWSNLIEAGGSVTARPTDRLDLGLRGAYVGLAQPTDRWSTATLVPVGAAPEGESRALGQEIDLLVGVEPWDPLRLETGYGLFVLGEAGRAVLGDAGRGEHDILHYAYAQARLRVP